MSHEPPAPREPGPKIGDLVIVPYPQARERLGLGPEVGLQLDDRRNVVQVYFPASDRTLWVAREQVESVALDRLPAHPLVRRLHRLARHLETERIEIGDDDAEESDVCFVSFTGASIEDLMRWRKELGSDVLSFRIEPGSMHRARIRLRFAAHITQPTSDQMLEQP